MTILFEAVAIRGKVIEERAQCISPLEAIRIYTWNGAYLGKDEAKLGSIEPGKLADL